MMRLTIVGFGNQARAWSENLKDSNFPFRVALKSGSSSFPMTVNAKVPTVTLGTADFFQDQVFALLTPDDSHHSFMEEHGKGFTPGTTILYAHGFSLLKNKFETKFPHLNHVLFAPKAIGSELRKQYQVKGKLGAVYSLEHVRDSKNIHDWLMEMSLALGINMGPYTTTFRHETEADLYSEQGLLCSVVPYTAGMMFKHLVETGIEPELAYFECWHELKLIVNAMVDKGPEGFFDLISPNALIGSEKGFHRLMDAEFETKLQSLLKDIQAKKFDDEIAHSNVEALRKTIRDRWSSSPLMKTFHEINRD